MATAVADLHDVYYRRHWDFDQRFRQMVLAEATAFLAAFDPARDEMWLVASPGGIAGSVAIMGGAESARLRWLIVDPVAQGRGFGKELLARAVDFCGSRFRTVGLFTFAGLERAVTLYERAGFVLQEEHVDDRWGPPIVERTYELRLR